MSKPIKNNSQLLYLQARQLFEQAQVKFEDGTIRSEPKLIETVFQAFQSFFTSMGKPNMVPRYAPEEGPPWSEDYNNMMVEIQRDLTLLFQEMDIIGKSLYTDFNHNMIQQEIIQKQFENVLDKIKDLEAYAGIGKAGVDIGRDDFLNKEKIDYSRITGTPLEVIDGAVTLPQISRENVAQNAQVLIVTGNRKANRFIIGTESNGFPGNNSEIHNVTDEILTNQNYIPTFLGEENNHSDYGSILDGSPNTWFEYEKVNIRNQDRIQVAKNLGLDYQVYENQTIPWAEDPDNGILKLHMQIVLEKETIINQINCNMYTPSNYGAKTAIVKNILVSDGKNEPQSIFSSAKPDDQYQFHFPPVKAKVISVLFEQPYKYITDIGHIFYEKKMQVEDASEYAMDMATKKYKYAPRTEGPLISLEDLGVKVNVEENNVDASYPLLKAQNQNQANIGETINRLMGYVNTESIDMGVEKFEGFRWCIGIRDIEVFSCEYAEEGELVTQPYFFDQPLDKIFLHVNEQVPFSFVGNDAMKYEWLQYYVSINDGATWYPITPMSHEVFSKDQPPKIYTVRTVESSEQYMEDKQAYIESEYPVYSLRMKIIAKRPTQVVAQGFQIQAQTITTDVHTQSSPILSSYSFNVQTMTSPTNSDASERIAVDIEASIGNGKTSSDGKPNTGGDNPWGDDDGDGIPNWADPDYPNYVPPSEQPKTPDGTPWQPPGNPGTYPSYPPILPPTIPSPIPSGPNDDDNGDGIPNYLDPDWKPPLTVVITYKKDQWCKDQDLHIYGTAYGTNPLTKLELLINNELKETKTVSAKYVPFDFVIPANSYPLIPITVIIKAYDGTGTAMDIDVMTIIDCSTLPPQDRPQDPATASLHVVIDKKVTDLCECDTLSFYGSAQGPNPIQSLAIRVNGTLIDPNNMGIAPDNDPCSSISTTMIAAQIAEVQMKEVKQLTEEELLHIEDFGEWLDAYEDQNDCGCKNKKKTAAPTFQMQSSPFTTMATTGYSQSFQVDIPYWKLRSLGAMPDSKIHIEVTAIDSLNTEAKDLFDTLVSACDKPPTDPNGNPRVRECWQLESVIIYYYDYLTKTIVNTVIPMNALPYDGIKNGMGTGITVGWNQQYKGPVIMQTSGYDASGYTFQIHAVGINYLNEYNQSFIDWAMSTPEKSLTVKNVEKMLGDATRPAPWETEMEDNGDYSNTPSLGKINDYIKFSLSNEWITKACDINIPDLVPSELTQPEQPPAPGTCTDIFTCNKMTHIVFQVYDEASQSLKIYKIDMGSGSKSQYTLPTKNGNVIVSIGWVDYFKGPGIQIKSAIGTDNVLLTAVGVMYLDTCGNTQTAWSTQLRYKTNGVHYADFVIGTAKTMTDLYWVANGIVDYTQATYIGKQGDMVAYLVDPIFASNICLPEKPPIDTEVGIDPLNPPDVPLVEFINAPTTFCFESNTLVVDVNLSDTIGLKEVTYATIINGSYVAGPYTDILTGVQNNLQFSLTSDHVIVGDSVQFYVSLTNIFGVKTIKTLDVLVQTCDAAPPVVTLSTTLTANASNKYCYSDLVNHIIPIKLRITDDFKVAGWTASCGTWNATQQYSSGLNDTDTVSLDVGIVVPAMTTDTYGRSYTPDTTYTVSITATDGTGKTTTQTLDLIFTDCAYDPTPPPTPEVPCGTTSQGGNGPATYYYVLGQTAGAVTVTYDFYGANDRMDIYYKDILLHATGDVNGTGTFTFNYSPNPDENRIKVVMNDGVAGSAWTYTIGCPVETTPPSGTNEGVITNSYNILARLKWGASPADMDFHAYVSKDPNRHLGYNVGGGDPANNIKAKYSDANGSMYLNYDWTGHNEDADFNNEYEVITINGFVNETITLIAHNFSNSVIDNSPMPTVELVDQATGNVIQTIEMPAVEWTTNYMRVIEFHIYGTGLYDYQVRYKGAISALDPTL